MSNEFETHRSFFIPIATLVFAAFDFFLIYALIAPIFPADFSPARSWLSIAIFAIIITGCLLLQTVYRLLRDLFFALLRWVGARRETRNDV